jgi:hypothetical protein
MRTIALTLSISLTLGCSFAFVRTPEKPECTDTYTLPIVDTVSALGMPFVGIITLIYGATAHDHDGHSESNNDAIVIPLLLVSAVSIIATPFSAHYGYKNVYECRSGKAAKQNPNAAGSIGGGPPR